VLRVQVLVRHQDPQAEVAREITLHRALDLLQERREEASLDLPAEVDHSVEVLPDLQRNRR